VLLVELTDYVLEDEDGFRVSPRVYTEPELYRLEMRKIFRSSWVYAAHESELAQPGDYVTTHLGDEPVIVSRDESGQVSVLVNACRHRAAVVCREERGNSKAFRCPYHGWAYRNNGALLGVAQRAGAYRGEALTGIDGLHRAARVESYRGLIFCTFNEEAPTLHEHLGAVRKHVDLWADMSPVPEGRVLPPHRFEYAGNWKMQAENGADGYHPGVLHQSAFDTLDHFGVRSRAASNEMLEVGKVRGFEGGHGILEGGPVARLDPKLRVSYEEALRERHDDERVQQILLRRHIFIFPNVYLMDGNIRTIHPRTLDRTEVRSFFLELQGVEPAINEERLRDLQRRLGTTGFIGPDDLETFAAVQTGARSESLQWMVLSRGLGREKLVADGEIEALPSDETPQRSLYREWARRMSA
jgi:phenylpropionate dioxygenase-like ring-hydroxylating dioxygenase large terminal subunit